MDDSTTGSLGNPSVTQMLLSWRAGDMSAFSALSDLVYEKLRDLARGYMSAERNNHTLQPTAVVNEAFLRLVDMKVSWQDRAHFFAVAARTMRRVLVDHAKAHRSAKRGGPDTTLSLDEARYPGADSADIVELDEALRQLGEHDKRKAELIELHYFGGLKYKEMAEVIGISEATVHRDLAMAKAYLQVELTR